jgi:hypothetical protein
MPVVSRVGDCVVVEKRRVVVPVRCCVFSLLPHRNLSFLLDEFEWLLEFGVVLRWRMRRFTAGKQPHIMPIVVSAVL